MITSAITLAAQSSLGGSGLLVFTYNADFAALFAMKQYASGRFAVESATISGGTGRFANTSGELSAAGLC